MSASWWPGRVRQFVRYTTGRVSRAERDALQEWLTPQQAELFDGMHRADRRHGLDVFNALRRAGHTDLDLLVAGLVHDCGKGRALHVWHRVGWSLSEHYGEGIRRAFLRLPTFGQAFATLAVHSDRSAAMAQAAGCSLVTVDLIRHQAEPVDQDLGVALQLADDAS
jgi:hypothetical protein